MKPVQSCSRVNFTSKKKKSRCLEITKRIRITSSQRCRNLPTFTGWTNLCPTWSIPSPVAWKTSKLLQCQSASSSWFSWQLDVTTSSLKKMERLTGPGKKSPTGPGKRNNEESSGLDIKDESPLQITRKPMLISIQNVKFLRWPYIQILSFQVSLFCSY